jgi:hypothetical protein
MKELAVDRNGWVRIAIPASRDATNVAFQCYPTKAGPGRCRVEVSRVLSLSPDYKPQFRNESGLLEMKTGEMREVIGEKMRPRP